MEEVSYKINHAFEKQQREDFVKAIIEKYPMKEFKTLEGTDLIKLIQHSSYLPNRPGERHVLRRYFSFHLRYKRNGYL